MPQRNTLIRLQSFRGGLNDTDPPHRIADDQLQIATDVELTGAGSIVRRPGTQRVMGPPTTGASFQLLHRHTPTQDLSATEVWACPINSANFYRSTSGTTWSSVANNDSSANVNGCLTDAVSFNGKLFFAYEKSAGTDRLNVWDGTSVRRVGISTPSAPTVADTGAGTYAATTRYYKVQFFYSDANGRATLSDLSDAQSFTPSGAGTAARVTKPTTPDSATSWRVWASADDVSYYLVASQVVGTTTWDDTTAPSAYATTNLGAYVAAEAGAYTPPWSAKYLLVDENRLLIAGAFETARYASRVGWSAILGTAAAAYGEGVPVGDDERFPPTNFLDLDSDEGGEITGMESLNGAIYVFKTRAIYKLVRTGVLARPYLPVVITKAIGALSRRSVIQGEDESGNPCLYFLSERGPYRLGASGLQYLGSDIEGLWATVFRSTWSVPPHGVYDPREGKVRWWVPRDTFGGGGTYPDCQIIFHVKLGRPSNGRVLGGWTTTATTSKAMYVAASAMLPRTLSARGADLAPHAIHYNGAHSYPPVVWRYTGTQLSDDVVDSSGAITGTEVFAPVLTTKAFEIGGLGQYAGITDTYLTCTPSSAGTDLLVTLQRDFGADSNAATETFQGSGTSRLSKQITDLWIAGAQHVAVRVTTSSQQALTLDEIALRVRGEDVL